MNDPIERKLQNDLHDLANRAGGTAGLDEMIEQRARARRRVRTTGMLAAVAVLALGGGAFAVWAGNRHEDAAPPVATQPAATTTTPAASSTVPITVPVTTPNTTPVTPSVPTTTLPPTTTIPLPASSYLAIAPNGLLVRYADDGVAQETVASPPAGSTFMYLAHAGNNTAVVVHDLNCSRVLFNGLLSFPAAGAGIAYPTVSLDGSTVAWAQGPCGQQSPTEIVIWHPADGSTRTIKLPDFAPPLFADLALSPDGKTLAASVIAGQGASRYVVTMDTATATDAMQATAPAGFDTTACDARFAQFESDGTLVALSCTDQNYTSVSAIAVASDGSSHTLFTLPVRPDDSGHLVDQVRSFSLAADGSAAIVQYVDGTTVLWNGSTFTDIPNAGTSATF